MQKKYSSCFQHLFIIRNSLELNFFILPLPWGFSELVAYKQQYAVKGKNNESLLLKQASKYFALSKNVNNRRLNNNEGCMTWTIYIHT